MIENEDKKSCTSAEFYLVRKLSARGFWCGKTRLGGAPRGLEQCRKPRFALILDGEGSTVHVDLDLVLLHIVYYTVRYRKVPNHYTMNLGPVF